MEFQKLKNLRKPAATTEQVETSMGPLSFNFGPKEMILAAPVMLGAGIVGGAKAGAQWVKNKVTGGIEKVKNWRKGTNSATATD